MKESYLDQRRYIRADATDMKGGLQESLTGEWSGNCDIGDGQLQQMKQVYNDHLSRVRDTCIYNFI